MSTWLAIDLAALWIVACIGLGWPLVMGLRPTPGRVALAGCLGAALATVVNGWAVVAGVFGRASSIALLAVGLAIALGAGLRAVWRLRRQQHDTTQPTTLARPLRIARRVRPGWWLIGLVGTAAFVAMLWEAGFVGFNHEDDFKSYLMLPARMLATGDYPGDPFNQRQFVLYGAGASLHANVLAIGGDAIAMRMLDRLGGGLLLSVALFGLARRFGGTRAAILAAAAPWLLVASWLRIPANVSPHFALGGLFAVLAWMELVPARRSSPTPGTLSGSWRTGALVGLGVMLKQTILPALALLLAAAGLIAVVRRVSAGTGTSAAIRQLLAWTGGVVVVAVVVALPWLVVKQRNYQTAIYPLTGDCPAVADLTLGWPPGALDGPQGHGPATPFRMMAADGDWAWHILVAVAASAAAAVVVLWQPCGLWRRRRPELAAIVLAGVGTLTIFSLVTRWIDADRYTAPVLAVGAALVLAGAGGRWHMRERRAQIAAAVLLLVALGGGWHLAARFAESASLREKIIEGRTAAGMTTTGTILDLEIDWILPRYQRAMRLVPEDEPLLHIGFYPAALPFETHTIWHMDQPGMMGYREACTDQTGAELRQHLIDTGVRWVLIDSLTLPKFDPAWVAGFYGRQIPARLGDESPYRVFILPLLRWLYELLPRLMADPGVTTTPLGARMWLVDLLGRGTPQPAAAD